MRMANKKIKRRLGIIILISLISIMFSSCGNFSTPERIAQDYFDAVKAGDTKGAIECMIPMVQEQFEASNSILSGLFGVDAESILSSILGTTNYDYYSNYDFEVSGTKMIDDSHAAVTGNVFIDGELSERDTIDCVKIGDKWYIDI